MQTLVFDTTKKNVILYSSDFENSKILFKFDNVPTVKINENFYEVMMKEEITDKTIPVLRVPIANTNMYIVK